MNALHPRIRIAWSIRGIVLAGVLGTAIAGLDLAVDAVSLPAWTPFALGSIVVLLAVLHALERHRRWRYEVQSDALYLERGVLTLVDTVVPFVRIQHVDTQRGPISRALGLSSVVVYTAGSRGADVTVPGLKPERARELRNRLRELAIESEPEDAV